MRARQRRHFQERLRREGHQGRCRGLDYRSVGPRDCDILLVAGDYATVTAMVVADCFPDEVREEKQEPSNWDARE